LLTNDIRALTPGSGCYAAWLTPQGRMLTDLHVFELGDMMLLDVPAELAPATLQRLDRSLFSEDVQLSDLAQTLTPVWIHGPKAAAVVQQVLPLAPAPGSWAEYQNARAESGGSPAVLVRVSQLGVPGFGVYVQPADEARIRGALEAAGASRVDPATLEAARIEAGYPLFGIDMTEETIPLEAGIEDRAISFTKGCYVGQEIIIRVLHRGHGRVARKLVGLRVNGGVPSQGAKIVSGDRDIGWVTSAAISPRFGSIALGYVQRDFVSPGTPVEIDEPSGRIAAAVSEPPIAPGDR
ncbi:MAG: YgfZ/GcvT domain-containing protein, partial [Vicinamibacterales bacterium]